MAKETVNFWTTGSDFTRLVRDLWEEGKPYNALECLEGLEMEVRLDIVEGRRKLEGDTRKGDGTLGVIADNYKGKAARQVFDEVLENIAKQLAGSQVRVNITQPVKNAEYLNEAAGFGLDINLEIERLVDDIIEDRELEMLEAERQEQDTSAFSSQLARFTGRSSMQEPAWSTKDTFGQLDTRQREIMRITNSNGRDLCQEHIEYQNHLWERGLHKENPGQTQYNSAWISPEGDFYGCPDMKHTEAAEDILESMGVHRTNPEHFLEEQGWVKLSAGRVVYFEKPLVPTIAQWEAVLAWMTNPINSDALSGKRVYNSEKNMYFTAGLIQQNINAAQRAQKSKA